MTDASDTIYCALCTAILPDELPFPINDAFFCDACLAEIEEEESRAIEDEG